MNSNPFKHLAVRLQNRPWRHLRLVWLLALAGATLTSVQAAPAERPCHDDVVKHCGDKVGDRDAMRQCMRANFSQFSEQCQHAIQSRRQQGGQRGAPAGQQRGAPSDQPGQ